MNVASPDFCETGLHRALMSDPLVVHSFNHARGLGLCSRHRGRIPQELRGWARRQFCDGSNSQATCQKARCCPHCVTPPGVSVWSRVACLCFRWLSLSLYIYVYMPWCDAFALQAGFRGSRAQGLYKHIMTCRYMCTNIGTYPYVYVYIIYLYIYMMYVHARTHTHTHAQIGTSPYRYANIHIHIYTVLCLRMFDPPLLFDPSSVISNVAG